MRAVLRSLTTIEHEPLESVEPSDPTDFEIWVRALLAPQDGAGEESFDFRVASPPWLARNLPERGFQWGRHLLIVDRWDPAIVESAVARLLTSAEGQSWADLGAKLASYAYWEFEDYHVTLGDAD